ncbi:hypothetical protein Cgig2_018693 [Carnegiea gigantea]|uniref:Uncharacterized protein n=1 Tax=Carnegiea gigantea TaxID=171969 RepID=A0A9Q1GSZ3_9CARY|nr:hypothetical protein Cgig2_018693 [Carnegiea gigantea]
MRAVTLPFGASLLTQHDNFNGELRSSNKDFGGSRVLFAPSLRLFQGVSAMDLSKVGKKILCSVRLLPATSGRPEVPARAAAAAAVARALASLSPDQRLSLPSSSAELSSMYGSGSQGPIIEELEEEFYEQRMKGEGVVPLLSSLAQQSGKIVIF